jgi:hypothetical protein
MASLGLLGLILVALPQGSQNPSETREIQILIEKLRSNKIEDRERAAAELKRRGMAVLPALSDSLTTQDVEGTARVREIVDSIRHECVLKAFGKLEGILEKARTITIKSECKGPQDGPRLYTRSYGKTLLEEGNRVSMLGKQVGGSEKGYYMILSNGRITRCFFDVDQGGPKMQASKTLTRDAIAMIVRLGLGPLSFSVLRPTGKDTFVPFTAAKDSFLYADLDEGEDGNSKTLSYTLKARDGSLDVAVKLWYDPTSARLIKRTVTQRDKARGPESATEIYTEFVLDAEIPADEFKVPGED